MIKRCGKVFFVLSIVFIFAAGLSTASFAQQEYQPEYQPEMMHPPEVDVTEEELDQVAEAYQEVTQIREKYQMELRDVTDPGEAMELQQQAEREMIEAVEDKGLDVQTYNQVMEAAQVDEELREKLLERLIEMN